MLHAWCKLVRLGLHPSRVMSVNALPRALCRASELSANHESRITNRVSTAPSKRRARTVCVGAKSQSQQGPPLATLQRRQQPRTCTHTWSRLACRIFKHIPDRPVRRRQLIQIRASEAFHSAAWRAVRRRRSRDSCLLTARFNFSGPRESTSQSTHCPSRIATLTIPSSSLFLRARVSST